MKYDGVLLVVEEMEKAKRFYMDVFGFEIAMDLGANISFKEGVSLQTKESWSEFAKIPMDEFKFGGNDKELVFTDNDLDSLADKLKRMKIGFARDEMPWGQRTIRFSDPDKHITEVGESMDFVAMRLLKQGMSKEKVSEITMIPMEFIDMILKNMNQ